MLLDWYSYVCRTLVEFLLQKEVLPCTILFRAFVWCSEMKWCSIRSYKMLRILFPNILNVSKGSCKLFMFSLSWPGAMCTSNYIGPGAALAVGARSSQIFWGWVCPLVEWKTKWPPAKWKQIDQHYSPFKNIKNKNAAIHLTTGQKSQDKATTVNDLTHGRHFEWVRDAEKERITPELEMVWRQQFSWYQGCCGWIVYFDKNGTVRTQT